MKLLITGAAGMLGTAVIDSLLKKMPAQDIAGFVRTEAKQQALEAKGVKAHIGDYDDVASLERAMAGIGTVLLISTGRAADPKQQHRNVVDAAKKAGVKCIAYTGRSLHDRATLVNTMMFNHFDTEDYIRESGLTYTIFRNSLYMDTIPFYIGAKVPDGIFLPAGEGRTAFALRKDQGEAIGNVLATEPCQNKTWRFTGGESYSFYDVAAALSELSGREIKYTPVDVAAFEAVGKEKHLPPFMIKMIADFNVDIKNGQEADVTDELETTLGRKPTGLKEGLKEMFGL